MEVGLVSPNDVFEKRFVKNKLHMRSAFAPLVDRLKDWGLKGC